MLRFPPTASSNPARRRAPRIFARGIDPGSVRAEGDEGAVAAVPGVGPALALPHREAAGGVGHVGEEVTVDRGVRPDEAGEGGGGALALRAGRGADPDPGRAQVHLQGVDPPGPGGAAVEVPYAREGLAPAVRGDGLVGQQARAEEQQHEEPSGSAPEQGWGWERCLQDDTSWFFQIHNASRGPPCFERPLLVGQRSPGSPAPGHETCNGLQSRVSFRGRSRTNRIAPPGWASTHAKQRLGLIAPECTDCWTGGPRSALLCDESVQRFNDANHCDRDRLPVALAVVSCSFISVNHTSVPWVRIVWMTPPPPVLSGTK